METRILRDCVIKDFDELTLEDAIEMNQEGIEIEIDGDERSLILCEYKKLK